MCRLRARRHRRSAEGLVGAWRRSGIGHPVDLQPRRGLRHHRVRHRDRDDRQILQRVPSAGSSGDSRAPVYAEWRRGRAPSLSRGGRTRFPGRRRTADPGTGEVRLHRGERPAAHRLDPQQALPLLVRRREACPFRDRSRRRRRLGQLRGHRVGEEDFRQALRPWSADPRRRRNGQAHGHSPEGAAGPADDDREPHVDGGRRPRRAARRKGRPLDGSRSRAHVRGHRRNCDRRDRAGADAGRRSKR